MQVGLTLSGINPKYRIAAAQAAEEAGFDSVWLPEHLVFPLEMGGNPRTGDGHPPIPPQTATYDVFVSLAMVAAATSRIRVGTNVYNIGLRHPFIVARSVASLDVLSNGRLDFGIGASWLAGEWEAMELDFDTRGRRIDETIEVCRRLWSEDAVEHHGEFFDFPPVAFNPKPTQQPQPPLIVGGDARAAQRRAATVGDSWFPLNHPLEAIPATLRAINKQRTDAGRSGTTTLTLSSGTNLRPNLIRYRTIGTERLITRPYTSSRTAIDEIRRFGDEVLSRFR
jgi:probable F420-dependent oxidoreductase